MPSTEITGIPEALIQIEVEPAFRYAFRHFAEKRHSPASSNLHPDAFERPAGENEIEEEGGIGIPCRRIYCPEQGTLKAPAITAKIGRK